MRRFTWLILLTWVLLAGCTTNDQPSLIVSLVVDGQERAYPQSNPITVGEFLTQVEVELGTLDDVTPPLYTQISDGMRVTVVRVSETEDCSTTDIAFQERRVPNEGLPPGEERVVQAGQSGVEETCYRVQIRDGVRQEPVPIRSTIITAPVDAVVSYGPTGELDPVQIGGTLAYISNGNVWIIRGSSIDKRPLTTTGDADNRVFALTDDGRQLLFSRETSSEDGGTFNQLWLINDTTGSGDAIALVPENIISADWVPGEENTISYSTGEKTGEAPGWRANNDLWMMRIDTNSGESLNARSLVAASTTGLLSWWGTTFDWSPDGQRLAWVRADSMGLVDLSSGLFNTLLTYPVFNTRQPWSWRATVSWSPDGNLILTTVHGLPIGSESAETSPAFHVAITETAGAYSADVVENAGIWSKPQYSPLVAENTGYIAYLRARDLSNSISGSAEYDLVVADRDGSNARVLYPAAGQAGITADAPFFTWSPDGQQIAFIYGGNLWVVDVESGIANQITLDRGASHPVWTR
ncbi:MAG: G5 domain-containing protein [Anaerolineae bacterium]|uniref:G5 domain-containing protein n=1 Tax=Candidatus Flexifilum breve TaxID=3140694 RepID=UPI001AC78479|nr:G5 domain-containing protein [Chloroflexota bacterium]MBK9749829.1 G5 domain-containing protein [Chloroflexota bacterium]MBN8636493.1 G5 domain-containing protein [Anaerolineae bacterium]